MQKMCVTASSLLGHLPYRRPRACGKCLCLADDDRHHRVNSNLEPPTHPHRIQSTVRFKSPVQSLYCDPAVVDHFPLGGFRGLSDNLLVRGIRVNNRLAPVLPSNLI